MSKSRKHTVDHAAVFDSRWWAQALVDRAQRQDRITLRNDHVLTDWERAWIRARVDDRLERARAEGDKGRVCLARVDGDEAAKRLAHRVGADHVRKEARREELTKRIKGRKGASAKENNADDQAEVAEIDEQLAEVARNAATIVVELQHERTRAQADVDLLEQLERLELDTFTAEQCELVQYEIRALSPAPDPVLEPSEV